MPQVEYVDEHIESLGHGVEAVGFVPLGILVDHPG